MIATHLSRRRFAAALALPVLLPRRAAARARQDAAALLTETAAAMAELESFHFELTTPQGTTRVLDLFELVGLEGDVQRPDRFRATLDAAMLGMDVPIEAVGIGDRLWVTDPRAGNEFTELQLDPSVEGEPTLEELVNPDRFWLRVLAAVTDPVVVGENEIDGEPVTRIDGFVDLRQVMGLEGLDVGSLAASPEAGALVDPSLAPLPVSLWIAESGHLRRLEVEGRLLAEEDANIIRRVDFSRFNEPVTIEPPQM